MIFGKLLKFLARTFKTQKELCVVCLGAVIYTVFFSVISFRRYEAFSYSDFDFAFFVHEAWKACHGSASISMFNDMPVWGNALELVSFMTAPLFFLFNFNPKGLLFLQSLALGGSAVPIFLIARRKVPASMSMCLALSFLFFPAVWYVNLYEYYPLVYTTFTLLMAFYFYEQNRFGWFLVFMLISMLNRVDVGLVTVMFGLYALTERRPWKWVLWPAFLSIGWVALGLFVIIPLFNQSTFHDSYYSKFGNGFGEIIKNMVLHPEILAKALFTSANLEYFMRMFLPVVFFPLLGFKQFMICSLSLLQHLVSQRSQEHSIFFHYTATITPFVYISTVYGIAMLYNNKWNVRFLCLAPIVFSLLANVQYGPLSKAQAYIAQIKITNEDIYKKKLLKEIPPDAVVTSSFEFSPMLAGRERFYSFHFIYSGLFLDKKPYTTPDGISYALINFGDLRLASFQKNNSDILTQKFLKDNRFGVVDRFNSSVLFKRGHPDSLRLYDVQPQTGDLQSVFDIEKRLSFLGADHQVISKGGMPVLRLDYRWQAPGKVYDDLWVFTQIIDENGQVFKLHSRPLCYGINHPSHWDPKNIIVEHYDLSLPAGLKNGEYKVAVTMNSLNSKRNLLLSRRNAQGEVIERGEKIIVGSFLKE